MIHQINIAVHVLSGTLALLAGALALVFVNNAARHKRIGRYFLLLLLITVATGFVGWLFFRASPFLLMLVLLSGYNGYSGYRSICRRSDAQTKWDFTVALVALALGFSYVLWLQSHDQNWSMPVIYSAVGALAVVTVYDLLKYVWLHRYVKDWWLYEHIYKMISAFSATLSAFTGTVLPAFKPYSQLGPSVFCFALIIIMICQRVLKARGRMQSKGLAQAGEG